MPLMPFDAGQPVDGPCRECPRLQDIRHAIPETTAGQAPACASTHAADDHPAMLSSASPTTTPLPPPPQPSSSGSAHGLPDTS